MFRLLFYPFGTIKRWPFVGGMLLLFVFLTLATILVILVIVGTSKLLTGSVADVNQFNFNNFIAAWKTHDMAKMFSADNITFFLFCVLMILEIICMFWCKLCLMMKRLRDLALSQWWALLPIVIGFVAATPLGAVVAFNLTMGVVVLIFYLLLVFYPSRISNN